MKKFTALILAAWLLFGTLCIGASAAGYGRNPHYYTITAQGDYIYYYEDGAIWAENLVNDQKRAICETDTLNNDDANYVTDVCVMGNSLYYISFYGYVVYKVDIGSGKKTEFYKVSGDNDDKYIDSIITAGNRVYVKLNEKIPDEVLEREYVYVYGTDGKYLKTVTFGKYASIMFMDTDGYEACIAAHEIKEEPDYSLHYGVYNIAKIKSDLSVEKITIPEKIGKKIDEFVYCDKKYVYYIEKESDRLCRYNTETEKYTVLVKDGVAAVKYKDGAVYFLTEKGDLKKYKNGKVSTVKKSLGGEFGVYFFDDYMLYEYKFGYDVIDYDGKKLV